ncbi:sensor domain-containing diguanylate cyclase [Gynuella sp.]|uniref:sensor domain-containing diguanylate cyclase n=1 Tax=Gynuella sp. TaxID=2969146 RepID=UPI003D0CD49B
MNEEKSVKDLAESKAKALQVLFDDPGIAAAMSRVHVFVVDHGEEIVHVSPSLVPQQWERSRKDAQKWLELVHPEDLDRVRYKWQKVVYGNEDVFDEVFRFQVNGEYRWISHIGTMVYRYYDGRPSLYIGADRDVTEERLLQQLLEEERAKLAQQIVLDDFLNIPNRRYLDSEQFRFFINDGETHNAVMVFDIDDFKQLNTILTHKGGDEVLQMVVERVQKCLGSSDILARYGGDEFVVVVPGSNSGRVHDIAANMLDAVASAPLSIDDYKLSISIGLCEGNPDLDVGFWDYFGEADKLLFEAKKQGKAKVISGTL